MGNRSLEQACSWARRGVATIANSVGGHYSRTMLNKFKCLFCKYVNGITDGREAARRPETEDERGCRGWQWVGLGSSEPECESSFPGVSSCIAYASSVQLIYYFIFPSLVSFFKILMKTKNKKSKIHGIRFSVYHLRRFCVYFSVPKYLNRVCTLINESEGMKYAFMQMSLYIFRI